MTIEFEYKPNQTCVYIPASALTSAMIWGHSFAFLPVKMAGGGSSGNISSSLLELFEDSGKWRAEPHVWNVIDATAAVAFLVLLELKFLAG